jgi:HprK-related kinase A
LHPTTLPFRAGPFTVSLTTDIAEVVDGIRGLYPPSVFFTGERFIDFEIGVRRGHGARRWLRPQALFEFDGQEPFKPLPLDQALPMFEWGLNYVIAGSAHWYLIVHGAAVERNGAVAILPGTPGSGKSTLAAGLVNRGWRLLSDELAMIRPEDGTVVPLARPISLKNESIEVMRRFAPGGTFTRVVEDTVKGAVALMRAPAESIERVAETAPPRWILFPLWQPAGKAQLEPVSKAQAVMTISRNSVNYGILGATGFRLLTDVVDRCGCFRFTYHSLDDAVDAFDALAVSQDAA